MGLVANSNYNIGLQKTPCAETPICSHASSTAVDWDAVVLNCLIPSKRHEPFIDSYSSPSRTTEAAFINYSESSTCVDFPVDLARKSSFVTARSFYFALILLDLGRAHD